MSCAEALPTNSIEIKTFELLSRRIGNRVNDDIESIPAFGQQCEEFINGVVVCDITGQSKHSIQFCRELLDPRFEFIVLVG